MEHPLALMAVEPKHLIMLTNHTRIRLENTYTL